jgi:hypothetical protein
MKKMKKMIPRLLAVMMTVILCLPASPVTEVFAASGRNIFAPEASKSANSIYSGLNSTPQDYFWLTGKSATANAVELTVNLNLAKLVQGIGSQNGIYYPNNPLYSFTNVNNVKVSGINVYFYKLDAAGINPGVSKPASLSLQYKPVFTNGGFMLNDSAGWLNINPTVTFNSAEYGIVTGGQYYFYAEVTLTDTSNTNYPLIIGNDLLITVGAAQNGNVSVSAYTGTVQADPSNTTQAFITSPTTGWPQYSSPDNLARFVEVGYTYSRYALPEVSPFNNASRTGVAGSVVIPTAVISPSNTYGYIYGYNSGLQSLLSGAGVMTALENGVTYYLRAYAIYDVNNVRSVAYSAAYTYAHNAGAGGIAGTSVTLESFTADNSKYSANVRFNTGSNAIYASEVGLIYSKSSNSLTLDPNNINRIDYQTINAVTDSWKPLSKQWLGSAFVNGDTWYARAYLKHSGGNITYSNVISGVVNADLNFVTYTPDVSNVEIVLDNGRVRAKGRVNNPGVATITERGFVVSYTNSIPDPRAEQANQSNVFLLRAENTGTDFSFDFIPDGNPTDLYLRAYAVNSYGHGHAPQAYHLVLNAPRPTVSTVSVENVMSGSADVSIMVNSVGTGSFIERGVVYSFMNKEPALDASHTLNKSATGTLGAATVSLEELERATTYYVSAYAKNSNGTEYGDILSFTTTSEDTLVTQPVAEVTRSSAKVSGRIAGTMDYAIRERGVVYSSASNAPTINNGQYVADAGVSAGDFTVTLSNLSVNTKYYARAYVRTAAGYVYGNVRSFTTEEPVDITTDSISEITNNQAVVTGSVGIEQGSATAITERGVVFSRENATPDINNSQSKPAGTSGVGTFNVTLTGLATGVKYYVRSYAKTAQGYVYYGNVLELATNDMSVTTGKVTFNGNGTVSVNGTATAYDATAVITEQGVVYSNTVNEPTVDNSTFRTAPVTGAPGSFNVEIAGLQPAATYYVRAYVKTASGVSYGQVVEFNMDAITVNTGVVTELTSTSAVVSGSVIGADAIIEMGMVYSTTLTEPTVSNSIFRQYLSPGSGEFTIRLDGLSPSTSYYVRSYVNAGQGYNYGNTVNFTTPEETPVIPDPIPTPEPPSVPGIFTDPNGPIFTRRASTTAVNLKISSGNLEIGQPSAQMVYYNVLFNDSPKTMTSPMYHFNGSNYLPLRALGEEVLDATLVWDEVNRIAILISPKGTVVEIFAGSSFVVVDGIPKAISTGAKSFVRDNLTYIPIRAVAEGLGYFVDFKGETSTIIIEEID